MQNLIYMPDTKELILVYNADSGIFNIIKDGLHKVLSPKTYQCNLCALTYGTILMKNEWKEFIDKLEIPTKFLHRDEFIRELESHPHNLENIEFPAIFLGMDEKITLLVNCDEINKSKTLDDLLNLITKNLSNMVK